METPKTLTNEKIKHELALWELCDKAQLKRFKDKWLGATIVVGFKNYRIDKTYMDDDHQVPQVELVNTVTSEVKYVQLSLIDDTYVNHSAINDQARELLYKELGINPDEVKV